MNHYPPPPLFLENLDDLHFKWVKCKEMSTTFTSSPCRCIFSLDRGSHTFCQLVRNGTTPLATDSLPLMVWTPTCSTIGSRYSQSTTTVLRGGCWLAACWRCWCCDGRLLNRGRNTCCTNFTCWPSLIHTWWGHRLRPATVDDNAVVNGHRVSLCLYPGSLLSYKHKPTCCK